MYKSSEAQTKQNLALFVFESINKFYESYNK